MKKKPLIKIGMRTFITIWNGKTPRAILNLNLFLDIFIIIY